MDIKLPDFHLAPDYARLVQAPDGKVYVESLAVRERHMAQQTYFILFDTEGNRVGKRSWEYDPVMGQSYDLTVDTMPSWWQQPKEPEEWARVFPAYELLGMPVIPLGV